MLQKYSIKTLLLFLAITFYNNVCAQQLVIAKDDISVLSSGAVGQLVLANAIANDSLYDVIVPITLDQIVLTQLSTDHPSLNLAADGSVTITGNEVAPGYYSIRYRICKVNDQQSCDDARINIFIGICMSSEAFYAEQTQYANCSNPTNIIKLYNLPQTDPWSIRITKDNAFHSTVNGTGFTTEIPLTAAGLYGFQLINTATNCTSLISEKEIGTLYCSTISISIIGTYNDYNADSFVNAGDVIDYQITIQNNGTTPVTNISLSSSNTTLTGNPIVILTAGSSNNSAYTARKVITQADMDNPAGQIYGSVIAVGTNPDESLQHQGGVAWNQLFPERGIGVTAFCDTNNDGAKNYGEKDFLMGTLSATSDNGGYDQNGYHSIFIRDSDTGHSYDIDYIVHSQYAAYYAVNPIRFDDIYVPSSGSTHYNFAVSPTVYSDVEVVLSRFENPRPGFSYKNRILLINRSPFPVSSGSLAFTKDIRLSISNISVAGATPTASGFTYDYTNLQPFETRNITVTMQVPIIPMVNLDDILTNTVTVSLPVGDIYPLNNERLLAATVIGSFDPNDKNESHGGKIVKSEFSNDDYLTYTIRFENTGTANAINVKVQDILDDQFDLASIKMVEASHNYSMKRTGNELSWTFAAIDLPPSVQNTDTGKGFLIFQIKPKPGFAVGDIIPNTAEIYFDFNPAIVTNVCNTEFVSVLAVADFHSADMTAYPNPVKNNWNISSGKHMIESIKIYDISGKIIYSETVKNLKSSIDLTFLSNGMYFAKVNSDGKSKTFKLIKA